MNIRPIIFLFFLFLFRIYYSQPNTEINKIHESKIGTYYSVPQDKDLIQKLDSFLLAKTEKLFDIFQHTVSEKVIFEFYSNEKKTLCDWDTIKPENNYEPLGCTKFGHKIKMVRPGTSKNSDSIYNKWGGFHQVMLHQFIHILIYDMVGKERSETIPKWILEGVTIYITKQIVFNKEIKEIINEKIKNNYLPSIQQLNSNKKIVTFPNIYHWSFLFCKYIIDTYGWDKMLLIITNYEHFYEIMGGTKDEINKHWSNYLKKVS